MSGTYTGSGQALVVNSKCNKLVPFTSSYAWTFGGDGSDLFLSKIEYNNSFIGSRIYATAYVLETDITEIGSDGLLNFRTTYYYDEPTDTYFIYVNIDGLYKKCKYASYELDFFVLEDKSTSVRNALKKKSATTEEFHKLLDSNENLKKIYLQIKAKLGK
jgi:hypothetical protein